MAASVSQFGISMMTEMSLSASFSDSFLLSALTQLEEKMTIRMMPGIIFMIFM